MLKKSIKQLLYMSYKALSFNTRRLLANSLLYSILRSASDDDLAPLEDAFASLDFVQVQIEDRIRQIKHSGRPVSSCRTTPILTSVIDDKAPWLQISVESLTMPGMTSDEEAQYYEYIGTLYEGFGAAVELGPWLGKSTRHIIRGLRGSPQFNNKKLFIFDDFIWRKSWMDRHAPEHLRLPNHSDFRALFESFVKDIQSDLKRFLF